MKTPEPYLVDVGRAPGQDGVRGVVLPIWRDCTGHEVDRLLPLGGAGKPIEIQPDVSRLAVASAPKGSQ